MYFKAGDFDITIKEITYNKYKEKTYTVIFEAEYEFYFFDSEEPHQKVDLNILEFKKENLTIADIKKKCSEKMAKMLTY